MAENPTAQIAAGLDGLRLAHWRVASAVLPVAWLRARAHVAELVAAQDPALIVHLGVAAHATTLRLELTGENLLQFRVPDVDGLQPRSGPVVEGAAPRLTTALDVDGMLAGLAQLGIAAERSEDAGRYVCNATYFSSLHAFGGHRVLFVHVPPVSEARPVATSIAEVRALLDLLASHAP